MKKWKKQKRSHYLQAIRSHRTYTSVSSYTFNSTLDEHNARNTYNSHTGLSCTENLIRVFSQYKRYLGFTRRRHTDDILHQQTTFRACRRQSDDNQTTFTRLVQHEQHAIHAGDSLKQSFLPVSSECSPVAADMTLYGEVNRGHGQVMGHTWWSMWPGLAMRSYR